MEAGGQHMEQKAAHELAGFQRHGFIASTTLLSVIFPSEAHIPSVEGKQALVGDRDAMGIA
jgi:hypothetical protein